MSDLTRLLDILVSMDVPGQRLLDFRWLSRNLHVRNSDHPLFEEAMSLIKAELRAENAGH